MAMNKKPSEQKKRGRGRPPGKKTPSPVKTGRGRPKRNAVPK